MAQVTGNKVLDRRAFLKGSALFAAAAVGLSTVTPAFAQEPQSQGKPEEKAPEKPAEDQAKKEEPAKDPNKLYDKAGREYRVCERCGGNMYKEDKTWTCEQCGLSYTE
jgi:secreted PhoX family phosphatase